ncbi:hypothetical protein GDO86_020634 [Hymenochirus boettgeri]|uniref:EGF-like domain-containing protein n=1 Tax=Hymenochirus boettgeri TaxID=247094 RepID=A0A8T2IGX7_9PIPI|nr:hypothetical protein GDO86_020634 [Hymenochirus boettgeri]
MAAVLRWLLLVWVTDMGSGAPQQVCTSCPGVVRNSSEVARRCLLTSGAQISARCCLNDRDAIIGLDLGNCSLTHLDSTMMHLTGDIVVIDFSFNPLQDLPSEFFHGLKDLQYLALPPKLGCPGGNDSWETVDVNSTIRICQDQKSLCNTTSGWVLLCPENSDCTSDGPGFTECICSGGFHGYKCQREGTFPMLLFFGSLGLVTISLSILLWCTQRRKVKSQ